MSRTPWGDADTLSSRRLRPGRGASREAVAANQRERVFTALTALSDERGYLDVRVDDLIAMAGISRGAFYAQFGSREDCLAAAVDSLVAIAMRTVAAAAERDGTGPGGGAQATLEALVDFASAQPSAMRLWLTDAYGAGPAVWEHAEAGTTALHETVARNWPTPPPGNGSAIPPADVLAGLLGGLLHTVATRIRHRRPGELPAIAAPLIDWLLSCPAPIEPLRRPREETVAGASGTVAQDQAERILFGVCEAVAAKGYAATTLADVAAAASTSIRTFYAHYESKLEAFIDAIDLAQVQSEAAARAAARRAEDWPHAVRNAVHATCGYLAANPSIARAIVVEPYAAGRRALERRDESSESFARVLAPGYEIAPDVPAIAAEAIGGAFDALLVDAVRAGGGARVRAVAPVATFIALAPFVGAAQATEIANDSGQPRRRARP
jgi:AcrR family transcriptional regulator